MRIVDKNIIVKVLGIKSGYFKIDGTPFNLSDADINKIEAKVQEVKTSENIKQKQKAFNSAIEKHLDSKAKEFRYSNMMSARSYTGYDNPFQAEAQKLAVWASNCWVKAGAIEADVEAGKRDMPTIDEVLSELPIYE